MSGLGWMSYGAWFGSAFDEDGLYATKIYYELTPPQIDALAPDLARLTRTVMAEIPGLMPIFTSIGGALLQAGYGKSGSKDSQARQPPEQRPGSADILGARKAADPTPGQARNELRGVAEPDLAIAVHPVASGDLRHADE